jgi:hypothetical protein
MDYTYINIGTFLIFTIAYYLLKSPLKYNMTQNEETYKDYTTSNNLGLAGYFFLVVIAQIVINAINITGTCGGNIGANIGGAFVLTSLPWVLIFGVIVVTLIINPGFKSVFSDIIGYYSVATEAHDLLTTILENEELEATLEPSSYTKEGEMKEVEMTGGYLTDAQKQSFRESSDVLIKVFGNPSFLINSVVPRNFEQFWTTITPLMKPGINRDEEKTKLFDLVYKRDKIGEFTWYVYTGILIASIVQMKLARRGCISDQATMEQNYQKYLADEQKAQEEKNKAASTEYTLN